MLHFEVPSNENINWNTAMRIIYDMSMSGFEMKISIKADKDTHEIELFADNGIPDGSTEFIMTLDCIVHEGGECSADAKKFCKLATMESKEDLEFVISESSCKISGVNKKIELPRLRFMNIDRVRIPDLIEINRIDFVSAIKNVGTNLKKNGNDIDTVMKFINTDGGTTISFFSADHHRMSLHKVMQTHQITNEIAIHQKSLKQIILFLEKNISVKWGFDDKSMFFKSGNMSIAIPLLPPYNADPRPLFLQETEIKFVAKVADLIEAIRRSRCIFDIKKDEFEQIICRIKGDSIVIKAGKGDTAMTKIVEIEEAEGAGECCVNPKYLESSLKNIKDNKALICFNDALTLDPSRDLSGVIVTGHNDDSVKHLIMQISGR